MFKNAWVYRIEHWNPPPRAELDERLAGGRFVACGATQAESAGWVAPRGDEHAALAEQVAGQWVLRLCTETKAVPAGAVKAELQARLDAAERETGRRPKGKRAKELKEQVVHELLPRAFAKRSDTLVWIDPEAGFLWVGAGSIKKADAVVTRLLEWLGDALRIAPLHTALSPATAMAGWLVEQEAPAGFSIDRDCELKQPDSEKAAVRYARHALELPEIAEHIRQGKQPTRLALTWASRLSFELTEAMALKKIKLTDAVLEDAERAGREGDDGAFDANVALITGELRGLLPALLEALGGLARPGPADATPAPRPAEPADTSTPPWDVAPA
jgi:recombination associated protein RdgC